MAEHSELDLFVDYQKKINEMLLQQNRNFHDDIKKMIDARIKSGGNGKFSLAFKIVFSVLMTLVSGITVYYVKQQDDWKSSMSTKVEIIQNKVARIETMLEVGKR